MITEAFIHFPGVELSGMQFSLDSGTLLELSFDEWFALDGTFAYADRKFARAAPVFWKGELNVSDQPTPEELTAALSTQTYRLHLALLLTPFVPLLPTPALSASYIVTRDPAAEVRSVTQRRFGPMEREWIVFGAQLSYRFDAASISSANAVLKLIDAFPLESALAGVVPALEALEHTARPDSWWGGEGPRHFASEFVHCIAACEGILLPPEDERGDDTITDLFGNHAAVLCDGDSEVLAAHAATYSELYRLRSRLIHGRIGLGDLTDGQWQSLREGRLLLRRVILGGLAARSIVPAGKLLPEWLAERSATRTKSAATGVKENE